VIIGGEFLALCCRRGGFPVGMTVLWRIAIPPVASLLLAPLLYFLLRKLVPVFVEDEALPKKPEFRR
jgi:hypothetical protein